MSKRSIISLLLCAVLCVGLGSCKDDGDTQGDQELKDLFVGIGNYGLYSQGDPVFTYAKLGCQVMHNAKGTMFNLRDDNGGEMLSCTLSGKPVVGEVVTVTYVCDGFEFADGEERFEVLRAENGKA